MRVVTIDGPAGAGKSTVARRVAERLGWRLLDTGAMYRAVAHAGLTAGIDLRNESAWENLVHSVRIEMPPGRVLLNDADVTETIRTVEVTRSTRFSADSPSVRARLVSLQRSFAQAEKNIVTEGRDQGTIVFPDAFLKFFLTASDEERARRRHAELAARGIEMTLEAVLDDVKARDAQDEARAIAPMRPASDAFMLDCTELTLDDVVCQIETRVRSIVDAPSGKPSE